MRMKRIRLSAPGGASVRFKYRDSVHAALVAGLTAAGADAARLIGAAAAPWTFATASRAREGGQKVAWAITVSSPDAELAAAIGRLDPAAAMVRSCNGDVIDLAGWTVSDEEDPVLPGTTALGVIARAPIAVSRRRAARDNGQRWHASFADCDLGAAASARLSALAGRPVSLRVAADPLYLRANPEHAVSVKIRRTAGGRDITVRGLEAPLAIEGSEEDLRLAWYAGIGEKTRYGFGCLGLAGGLG